MSLQRRKKTFSFGNTEAIPDWEEVENRIKALSQKVFKESKSRVQHKSQTCKRPARQIGLDSQDLRRIELFGKSESYLIELVKILDKNCKRDKVLKDDLKKLNSWFINQNVNKD